MNSEPNASEFTLQINLCAGDLDYAAQTVSALVAAHRAHVGEVVVVADGCRPAPTPWSDARRRFPAMEFESRLRRLHELCATLQRAGTIDRVAWLHPDRDALRQLNRKYTGTATARSHDHLGHAFSAYFLGWETARTRYIVHFDADIVLWQQAGFSWIEEGRRALEKDKRLLGASPRIAPPLPDDSMVRVGADGCGWQNTWLLEPAENGWHSPWFSTRCHLIDLKRLASILPLTPHRQRLGERRAERIDRLLSPLYSLGLFHARPRRLMRHFALRVPAFPLPPEVLLHEHSERTGMRCLYLADPRAWFVHPDTKSDAFLRLLPRLLVAAGQRGEFPLAQRGRSGIDLAAWEAFGR